jgi:hypothetical protein
MAPRGKPPHPGDLIQVIRKLARAHAYRFSDHAFDREDSRGIDAEDARKVLTIGDIQGEIVPGKNEGEWRCCVVGPLPWTSREAGVVTVVIREAKLLIVTVEWMDL